MKITANLLAAFQGIQNKKGTLKPRMPFDPLGIHIYVSEFWVFDTIVGMRDTDFISNIITFSFLTSLIPFFCYTSVIIIRNAFVVRLLRTLMFV